VGEIVKDDQVGLYLNLERCGEQKLLYKNAGKRSGKSEIEQRITSKRSFAASFAGGEGPFPDNRTQADSRNVTCRAAMPAARRGPWADNNNMLDRRLQLYLVGDSLGHHTHDHNQVSTDS